MMMLLAVVLALVSTLLPYRYVIKVTVALLGATIPVLVITQGFIALKRGYRPARYFLLAWTSFMIGMLLYALKGFGLIPTFLDCRVWPPDRLRT